MKWIISNMLKEQVRQKIVSVKLITAAFWAATVLSHSLPDAKVQNFNCYLHLFHGVVCQYNWNIQFSSRFLIRRSVFGEWSQNAGATAVRRARTWTPENRWTNRSRECYDTVQHCTALDFDLTAHCITRWGHHFTPANVSWKAHGPFVPRTAHCVSATRLFVSI